MEEINELKRQIALLKIDQEVSTRSYNYQLARLNEALEANERANKLIEQQAEAFKTKDDLLQDMMELLKASKPYEGEWLNIEAFEEYEREWKRVAACYEALYNLGDNQLHKDCDCSSCRPWTT